jgi:opacity protein-like surface antigen
MKTKTLATLVLCTSIAVMSCQSSASEQPKEKASTNYWRNVYLRADFAQRYGSKASGFSKRPKTESAFGGGIGYSASGYPMRFEFDIQRSNFSVADGPNINLKARIQTYMLNIYKDFPLPDTFNRNIAPYLTAGVGRVVYSGIKGNTSNAGNITSYNNSNKKSNTWSAGAGVKFDFSRMASLDVGLKYISLRNLPAKSSNTKATDLQAGVSLLIYFFR